MPTSGRIVAWITPDGDGFTAFMISAAAIQGCPPATRLCSSGEEARQWVESRAAACGFDTEWVAPVA